MLPLLLVLLQRPGGEDEHSNQADDHPRDEDAEVAAEVVLGAEDDSSRALDLRELCEC